MTLQLRPADDLSADTPGSSRWNELPAECPVMVLFQQLELLLSIGFTFTSA